MPEVKRNNNRRLNRSGMNSWYARYGKRLLDIMVSAAAVFVLFPVLFIIALTVRLTMGKSIFFAQERPGIDRKPFRITKYRTMSNVRNKTGELCPDDVRITSFGRVLRRTSLDELPELINVLKGDMSLVGPRPLLMDYLTRYTPYQARRMEVKPGITGWAQVNGRNAIDWEEKFKYDVWYVDHVSFWLDLKILLMTVLKVFIKEGISYENHATMPGFIGAARSSTNVAQEERR